MPPVRMVDGVLRLDGRAVFLTSADYPYYRDRAEHWADRLGKLRALGFEAVTCYIPWRHHEVATDAGRRFDFDGTTRPNRNVRGFLRLCAGHGLRVIAKPGPFIHAETNYGGLPDFVCPLHRPDIEPMRDHLGNPVVWPGAVLAAGGRALEPWPLPAPFDPGFLAEAERWLSAVTEQVLRPMAHPAGPVVLVQVGNEGVYSNAQYAVWAYDFSQSSLAAFRAWLRERYPDLPTYNRIHEKPLDHWEQAAPPRAWQDPADPRGARGHADWSAFQADYLGAIFRRLGACLDVGLPLVANVNPPLGDHFGADAWLSRIDPDRWPEVGYGFTDWIGVACDDPSVVDRYQLMVKRRRGVNLEENWGFADLYDPAYAFDSVCFHQTLLAVALGATGYNVYTGVGTSHADPGLDRLHGGAYPVSPPITPEGEVTPKARTAALLNDFFGRHGEEFLATRPVAPVAWGLYLPYHHVRAWSPAEWSGSPAGIPDAGRWLMGFARELLAAHVDFGLLNLQTASPEALAGYPFLVLSSGRSMGRAVQEKLRDYAERGGHLVAIGGLPDLDEAFEACRVLERARDSITVVAEADFRREGIVPTLAGLGLRPPVESSSSAHLWLYAHPSRDVQYLFVLTPRGVRGPVRLSYHCAAGTRQMELDLPAGSGAVARIADGRISAVLVKGRNDYLGEHRVPLCRLDGEELSADRPCDLLAKESGGGWFVRVGGPMGDAVRVRLPTGQQVIAASRNPLGMPRP